DLDDLLEKIEGSKIQDWLLAASETSYSYQLKLLLMTDDQQLTYDRVEQEYNLDPRYSLIVSKDCLHNVSGFPEVDSSTVVKIFGNVSEDGSTVSGYSGSTLAHLLLKLKLERVTVFSIDGTTTTDFQHDFIRAFRFQGIKAVLETSQGDKHMYQMMGEMDRVSEYHTLKRPVGHTTQYDHQQILLMEDNSIVRKAAGFLYEKHPAVSSVYVLDEHLKPKLIHGDSEALTADSRLVLVGHGGTNNEGGTSISGYNAKEVAKIIGETHRNGDQIKTLSLVACDVGSDKHFIETLMKELHEANIETELHLRNTEVQVSHTGEKYSVEFNTNGLEWRHKDARKKVVATLDQNMNVIIREQTGNTGEAVFTSERNPLGPKESWPEVPQDFIHSDVQTENSVKHSCVEAQGLAWGMFHKIQDHPQKTKAVNGEYRIYEMRKNKVDQKNLYVYPVGKKLDNNDVGKIKEIKDCITAQIGQESYYKMRQNIYKNLPSEQQENEKVKYVEYLKEQYSVVDPSQRDAFLEGYSEFKTTIQQQHQSPVNPERPPTSGGLGGSDDGSVTLQDLHHVSESEISLKLASYYSRAAASFAKQIHDQLNTKYGEDLAGLLVKQDSAKMEDGTFKCQLLSADVNAEPIDFNVDLPADGLQYNEKMLKSMNEAVHDMETHGSDSSHHGSKHIERASTAVGTLGLMLGMKGAVQAFERGDIKDGVIGTAQTLHGVTGMTLAVIGKQAEALEGRVAKSVVKLMRSSPMKIAMQVLPIVGIGFGIYNVQEDFKRNDTLRYIDAALDLGMVGLDIIEAVLPELAPFFFAPLNLALAVIRIAIDDVYMGIQNELNSLPIDAGLLEKLAAVLVGSIKGFFNFLIHVESFFYNWRYDEIEQGHKLVEQISDYREYYKVTAGENGTKAINFSSGGSSWNGGGIHFDLKNNGLSELCMDFFVSSDESVDKKCWDVNTSGSRDIILGIGESHQLNHTTYEKKVLLFIPAGSETVVSGYIPLSESRYGHYKGNSEANRFFAVQNAQDKHTIEVMLSYYYRLHGEPGDDTFFLGSQKSYVKGSGGKDTYIIPDGGGKTTINNYDPSMSMDTLVFSVDYSDISVSKSGADVILTYHDCHTVTIQQWFSGEAYRHMTMMSRDGVLFIISSTVIASVKLVARGINKMSQNHSVTVDTTTQHLSAVINILGSPYDDRLIGNGEKNVMDGGGGEDHLIGGEDEDIYMVKNREKSKVWIQNHSTDKTTDLVLIDANLHDFKLRVDEDHIILQSFNEVVLLDWFRSEADRHLQVLTKDLVTFTLSDSKSDCVLTDPFTKCIRSQSIDYSKSSLGVEVDLQEDQALHSVTEVRGSDLNDVIKGNQGRNTIFPGKGDDFVEGRGGEDWYVITPGQGLKTINNYSPDMAMDTMFLKEQYQHIMSVCEGNHVILLVNGSESVVLKQWFISNMYQHLDFQTTDGITFKLGSNTTSCGGSLMLPITVDYRKQETRPLTAQFKQQKLSVVVQSITTVCFNYNGHSVTKEMCGYQGRQMIMNDIGSVMNLYGSAGFDVMIGNNNNNLLDPFTGGALMSGGEGRDTYIIKPGYGHDILIDNFAEDMYDDTMLVAMDFLSGGQMILTTVGKDLKVNITNGGEILHICLLNYHSSPKHQHLILQSSDGVFFRLKDQSGNESNTLSVPHVEAFKVNMKETQANCHLDLYAQGNLSAVHTVQGCPSVSNYIQGHNQQNILIGGWKNDVLEGGQGNDVLMGGVGNDLLMGGFGDDTLYGEVGEDTMMGGSGWDLFIPGPGADLVDGGPGRDTVLYQGDHEKGEGVYVNLLSGECRQADAEGDVLKDVENVIGSIYSDVLVSGFEAGLLKGSDGHDILVSSGGGDYLVGGEGNDLYALAFHQGSLTIDNCAKDNRTDILYLSSDFSPQFECHQLFDRAVLTFSGVNERNTTMCVKVTVQGWVSDEHECGHLVVALGDREMSVDRMLEECFFRHIEPVRAHHQHMSHMLLSYTHLAQLYQESEFQEEN
ncbi:hypothetical protein NHX12_028408, partial [Muraenolepis orangiensis]